MHIFFEEQLSQLSECHWNGFCDAFDVGADREIQHLLDDSQSINYNQSFSE